MSVIDLLLPDKLLMLQILLVALLNQHSLISSNNMKLLQTNIFQPISVSSGQRLELVDIFSGPGKKSIELDAHSSLTYLVIASDADIHIDLVTK